MSCVFVPPSLTASAVLVYRPACSGCAIFVIAFVTTGVTLAPKLLMLYTLLTPPVGSVVNDAVPNQRSQASEPISDSTPAQTKKPPSKESSDHKIAQGTRGYPSTTRNSTAHPVPLPRTNNPTAYRSSAISPIVTPVTRNRSVLTPNMSTAAPSMCASPPAPRGSTPASPRIHVSRGVSVQLMQMLVQQLAQVSPADGQMQAPVETTPASPNDVTVTIDPIIVYTAQQ
jgi:hypothetical protein